MFILGTHKAWKELPVTGSEVPVKLFIASMSDKRRGEILASIAHLRGDSEESMPEAYWHAVLQAYGRECIKAWQGVGGTGDDGQLYVVPCTPENIDAFVIDEAVSGALLIDKINEVCRRIAEEVKAAGNESSVGSTGTAEAAPTP